MAVSGLIVAYLPRVGMVWLAVDNDEVVDACRWLRPKVVGGCPRTAWVELHRQAFEMWWLPRDRRQQPVRQVPRRDGSVALSRLRRGHARLGARASAGTVAA